MGIINLYITYNGVFKKFGFRGFPEMVRMLKMVNQSCKDFGYSTEICIKFPITRNKKKYEGDAIYMADVDRPTKRECDEDVRS